MGVGLEVVTGFDTAPGVAAFVPLVACNGNSFQVRAAPLTSKVWFLNAWAFNNVAGQLRIRSPRLHDAVNGMRWRVQAALVAPLYPQLINAGFNQFLIPQDTLIVENEGSAVGGNIEMGAFLVYYANVPGISARLINNAQLQQYGVNVTTIQASVVTVATGQYGGAVLVNAATQNLKANTDYALLGGGVDTRCCTVRVTGIDFGSLGVGFPGEPSWRQETGNWFQGLSIANGLPIIPVFNSANFGGITIDIATNQAAGTMIVDLNVVELQAGSVPPAGTGSGS